MLIDTGDAVARQLGRLLGAAGLDRKQGEASLLGFTSASATALEAVEALSRPGVTHLLVARDPNETPQGVVADIDVIALCTGARR